MEPRNARSESTNAQSMASTKIRPLRALLKTLLIFTICALILFGFSEAINDRMLSELKHQLSPMTIIALVVIINLVSLTFFIAAYLAYRWVRRDLKPIPDQELDV